MTRAEKPCWDLSNKGTMLGSEKEEKQQSLLILTTLIKNKIKFSSYIRKFRGFGVQSHIWLMASSYSETICAFPHIFGSPSSYMTLHPIPSEFPYIWGKFCFLFISAVYLLFIVWGVVFTTCMKAVGIAFHQTLSWYSLCISENYFLFFLMFLSDTYIWILSYIRLHLVEMTVYVTDRFYRLQ